MLTLTAMLTLTVRDGGQGLTLSLALSPFMLRMRAVAKKGPAEARHVFTSLEATTIEVGGAMQAYEEGIHGLRAVRGLKGLHGLGAYGVHIRSEGQQSPEDQIAMILEATTKRVEQADQEADMFRTPALTLIRRGHVPNPSPNPHQGGHVPNSNTNINPNQGGHVPASCSA